MSSGLHTARQALKLGCALGAFSTLCAFGQLADANVSEAAALHAQLRPLAARIGGDFSDAALARALGIDPQALRDAGAPTGMDLSPNPLLAGAGPGLDTSDPDMARRINAATPFGDGVAVKARPFMLTGSADNRQRALTCLTQAVYFEAASEGDDGERAVAQVVLNRMRNDIFPHSVCGVVYQGSSLPTGCQFSFTCDGSLNRPQAGDAWDRAGAIARQALHGAVFPGVGLATHYHADYVAPWWRTSVAKVAQIGVHIFYRWPGALGQPQAFTARYTGVERFGAPPAPDPGLVSPEQPQMQLAAAVRGSDGRVHAEIEVASAAPPPPPVLALAAPPSPPPSPVVEPEVEAAPAVAAKPKVEKVEWFGNSRTQGRSARGGAAPLSSTR